MLRRREPLPGPALPAAGVRPGYEIRAEADLLCTYKQLILGPEFLGTDLYQQLLSALAEARNSRVGLTELLLQFGVTDVTGLVLLFRAVALTTSISTLGWVLDDTLPAAFLHQTGTYRHPLTD